MRRIIPFFLASAAAIAASDLDNRINALEGQMQDLRVQTVYCNYGANTASAYPCLPCGYGAYFVAEGLYWKFFEGGTDFVYVNGPNANPDVYVDRLRYLDFDWRFAYRFTAGYQLKSPDLDLWATFTRFTTHQSATANQPTGGQLFPNQNVTANTNYTSSKESLKLFYNVLDLNLGRTYFLRSTFSAHPFVGLRGAKIDQRSKASWTGSATSDFNYKWSNNFWGAGIQVGTRGDWQFTKNWSVFGSILGSLLYGWYDVDTTIQQTFPTVSTLLSLQSNLRAVVPNMAADAGVRWQFIPTLCCNRALVSVTLAYEFQYWWAQNQALHTDAVGLYSWRRWAEDFGMQGVKLNLGVDF